MSSAPTSWWTTAANSSRPIRRRRKIRVKVGWVKGLNRLYFLYEADDDYWDFAQPDLHNDTFELVVDGDLSGGPLIEQFMPARDILGQWETYYDVARRARAELSHLHAGGGQGLVHGVGSGAMAEGTALRELGAEI